MPPWKDDERARLLEQLQAAQRSQAFLLQAADALARTSGFAETLQRLAAVAVPTLGDVCLIDVVTEGGRLDRKAARHADPARQPLVDELERHYPPDPVGAHPSAAVIRTGKSRSSAHMSDEFLRATCQDQRHFELTKALDFTSYMTVPLVTDGEVLGAVTLISAGSGRRFDADDLSLAEDLAGQVAAVIAKERRYDEEHNTAHLLQAHLLPAELPSVAEFDIAVRYLPGSRGAEVGGDFYDVVVLPSGHLGVMIGDVAGHDAGAAAIMGQLRSAARALAGQVRQPGELVEALQQSWQLLGFDRIATALFVRVSPGTGRMAMASAGHPPPLLVAGGQAAYLPVEPSGPLGGPMGQVTEWRSTLGVGEVFLLYTDGLIEHRRGSLDEGMARGPGWPPTAPPTPNNSATGCSPGSPPTAATTSPSWPCGAANGDLGRAKAATSDISSDLPGFRWRRRRAQPAGAEPGDRFRPRWAAPCRLVGRPGLPAPS